MAGNKGKGVARGEATEAEAIKDGSGGDEFLKRRPLHGRTSGPTRRSTKGHWTPEEDSILCRAVQRYKGKSWKKIAECFPDRSDVQCLHRWQKVLNPALVKGPWSKEEDDIIIEMVSKYGAKKWANIAQALPGRIGKQCRERWHNHLNPAINKDAWTQEEEIILIHAHRIYGNKWAELTKVLPGRTDNSIKNHWNSSVKKKLDSYIASGLLEKFQGLPHVENLVNCISLSTSQQHSEDSGVKDGVDVESSECSQGSVLVGSSQSDIDVANTVSAYQGLNLGEVASKGQVQDSHLFVCPKENVSMERDACAVPEIQCHGMNVIASNPTLSHEVTRSESSVDQVCPNISLLEGKQESQDQKKTSEHDPPYVDRSRKKGSVLCPYSLKLNIPPSAAKTVIGSGKQGNLLISEDDRFPDKVMESGVHHKFPGEGLTNDSNISNLDGCMSSINYQSDIHNFINGSIHGSCPYPMFPINSSNMVGISYCQSFMTTVNPSLICPEGKNLCACDNLETRRSSVGPQDLDQITCSFDSFSYSSWSFMSPSGGTRSMIPQCMEHDQENKAPKHTLAEKLENRTPETSAKLKVFDENTNVHIGEQQGSGALFYEPPRFPSFEIPFVSCDLISSSGELQQAYSPLGIRQLMMSSTNSSMPYSLWDSPSQDDSPGAVLRNEAKNFICTPSIMKKRQRELLSPLQERRIDKKSGKDLDRGLFSTTFVNRKESSSMDVISDQNGACKISSCSTERIQNSPISNSKKNSQASVEHKENKDGSSKCEGHGCIPVDVNLSKGSNISIAQGETEQCAAGANRLTKADSFTTKRKPTGLLVEHNVNDIMLFSPVQDTQPKFSPNTDARAAKTQTSSCMDTVLNPANLKADSECLSNTSTTVEFERKKSSASVSSGQDVAASQPLQATSEKFCSSIDVDLENLNIFADTPRIKRGIESPSAWKSPWFMNSLLPGQRFDTDLMFEDIGYFMSPDDRTYDAIGLMRQFSGHTAAALAEAHEVLTSGNPVVVMDEAHSGNENSSKENCQFSSKEQENLNPNLPTPPNVMAEGRVLDFSECATPRRPGNKISATVGDGMGFSSPSSSYLLKGCR